MGLKGASRRRRRARSVASGSASASSTEGVRQLPTMQEDSMGKDRVRYFREPRPFALLQDLRRRLPPAERNERLTTALSSLQTAEQRLRVVTTSVAVTALATAGVTSRAPATAVPTSKRFVASSRPSPRVSRAVASSAIRATTTSAAPTSTQHLGRRRPLEGQRLVVPSHVAQYATRAPASPLRPVAGLGETAGGRCLRRPDR